MENLNRIPSIFISHGPPGVLLKETDATLFLQTLSGQIPRPSAILCVSAHWETSWPMLTAGEQPGIIYDFGGPPALFRMTYPAPGSPELAGRAMDLIRSAGFRAVADASRGFDHGTWTPLSLMYPDADIPVVQLSIQTEQDPLSHLNLGRALTPLKTEGVLIIGSGGAVHNLDEIHEYRIDSDPPGYGLAFDRWLEEAVTNGRTGDLVDYRKKAPSAERCHPWPAEHFLPLFVPMGASGNSAGKLLHGSFLYGVLSMAAYIWP